MSFLQQSRPGGLRRVAALALTIATISCGRSSPSEAPAAAPAAPADPGRVAGNAPAAVGNFTSIVVLEPVGTPPPSQGFVPVMDQVQQNFIPPMLVVQTGHPVEFRNNDDVLHNVKVREDANGEGTFNVAIPTGEKFIFAFSRDGFYDVGCDIHPGMSAQIMATSTPYSTLADARGAFAITDVPAGPYKAIAYAGDRKIERDVTVPVAASVDLTAP